MLGARFHQKACLINYSLIFLPHFPLIYFLLHHYSVEFAKMAPVFAKCLIFVFSSICSFILTISLILHLHPQSVMIFNRFHLNDRTFYRIIHQIYLLILINYLSLSHFVRYLSPSIISIKYLSFDYSLHLTNLMVPILLANAITHY